MSSFSRRLALVAACATLGVAPLAVTATADAHANHRTAASAEARTAPRITISNFGFHGPSSVKHGARITVVNRDKVAHTVTSNSRKFNVFVPAGATRTFKAPSKAGTYRYHCTIHPDMHGTLKVK